MSKSRRAWGTRIGIGWAVLLYALLFSAVFSFLAIAFLSREIGISTTKLYHDDLSDSVSSVERLMENELDAYVSSLRDYAALPQLTQAVLDPSRASLEILQFLEVLQIRGRGGNLALVDFRGNALASKAPLNLPGLDAALQPILDGTSQVEVKLFERDGSWMWLFVIPIQPGGLTEGALVYTLPFEAVVVRNNILERNDVAYKVFTPDRQIVMQHGQWNEAEETIKREELPQAGLHFEYQMNKRSLRGEQRKAQVQMLGLLAGPILLACLLAIFLGDRLFGRPLRSLRKRADEIGKSPEKATSVHVHSIITEVDNLSGRIDSMQQAIAERTLAMERSNKDLEHFAYVAAHDLREPLRTIVSYLDLLESESGDKLEPESGEYIKLVQNRAKRMMAMLEDLLSMSRLKGNFTFESVDLNQAVQVAISNLEQVIGERKATLELTPLPRVPGQPAMLELVFQNLIANALKFSAAGRPPVIRIIAEEHPAEWSIHVADNGIGFDAKYREQIFNMFTRLQGKDKHGGGSGIGLSICKRVMELHRGSISATGVRGQGATFTFTLPKHPLQL